MLQNKVLKLDERGEAPRFFLIFFLIVRLAVEGRDDEHVVCHLIKKLALNLDLEIIEKEGKDNLLISLKNEFQKSDRKIMGIMMDGNDSLSERWQAIGDRLNKVGINLPSKPNPNGTIIKDKKPHIGVWLMPDNKSPGELEDFIQRMIPEDDLIWDRAEKYVDEIPKKLFKEKKLIRAKVHAWLAVQEKPRPMGLAITTGDLDVNVEIAKRFVGWLKRLYDQDN